MKSSSVKSKRKNAPGQRLDPRWEHGIKEDGNPKRVKCRHEHHLACTRQNVEVCPKVPEEVKQKFRSLLQTQLEEPEKKKRKLYDVDECVELEHSKRQKGKSLMDNFVMKKLAVRQTTSNEKFKEKRNEVRQPIARIFYTSAIPFKRIGDYGKGLIPPYYEFRETSLKKEVREMLNLLENFRKECVKTGCTIMLDGWSGRKGRSLCNFLVNSPSGTIFLSSQDTSEISKTNEKVFEMLDEIVGKVGEENVVQVVTYNVANYKLAGQMLMEKRKRLFWTPCAAHCIDLMLKDFEKKNKIHHVTIAKAMRVVSYIYSRTVLTHWMKEFTDGKELLRPAVTRFATSYLTLQRLQEQKGALMSLFSSSKWKSSKFAKEDEGKKIADIVLDNQNWKNVQTCLKASLPLVKVLRLVDSDERPTMGFIYEAMDRAKKQIQRNFNDIHKSYGPIWEIIDDRWTFQPLHAAAYFLNPQFQYSSNFNLDVEVKCGLYSCLHRMVRDSNERVKIDLQMDAFKQARGLFGIETAKLTRNKKSPADWWESYGDECPELKRFAIKILSLTCSSSGCERNWSAFEMVHSKRRNRLHQKKLNDLVFVTYNIKLRERHMNRQAIIDPICLEDFPSDDEWTTKKENPVLPAKKNWLRVLENKAQEDTDEEDEVEVITRNIESAWEVITRNIESAFEEIHEIDDDDEDEDPLNHSRNLGLGEEFGETGKDGDDDVDDDDDDDDGEDANSGGDDDGEEDNSGGAADDYYHYYNRDQEDFGNDEDDDDGFY